MNRKLTLMVVLSAAAVAVMSGCGGGGADPADPPPPAATDAVPDSASASVAGLKAYLEALAAMQVDDKEPVDLSTFSPTTSEDAEPEPVD